MFRIKCFVVSLVSLLAFSGVALSQPLSKLSLSLRSLLLSEGGISMSQLRHVAHTAVGHRHVCALVRMSDEGVEPLSVNGCRLLAQIGDICVADIPVSRLGSLAADSRVCRIEAERGNMLQLDSMRQYTDANAIYTGHMLPQAYTGRGVVVGVMDVGFDLTHPTFRDGNGKLRISRVWDQLSVDTVVSAMYVGAEYTGERSILDYAHSRDGMSMYHGTHTLGIVAGSGAGTPYTGMAPESDLCLVSNAVTGDQEYISDADIYKYTTATDVLGFKYLFDYASEVGKPCVVSFSEGMLQDFYGESQLFYEALARLTGPGRIIVASAGNRGMTLDYVHKPYGRESAGSFLTPAANAVGITIRSHGSVALCTKFYGSGDEYVVALADVCASPDSLISDTIYINNVEYVLTMQAYQSCFDSADVAIDVELTCPKGIWLWRDGRISFELTGSDGEAEMFAVNGYFSVRDDAPWLNDATATHNILSPGSAPGVICVGATAYRSEYTDVWGVAHTQDWGRAGMRASYSSVGPTYDGRVKPDVMAPGTNVISSMSSYFLENHSPETLVSRQDFEGRTYGWSAETGTSMSAPAVAGIIALWLQANPYLSPTDVLGVIRRTSHPCGDYGSDNPNYCGSGAIDAYAGLLDVLGLTGVEELSTVKPRGVSVSVGIGNVIHIVFDKPLPHDTELRVYGIDGMVRARQCILAGDTEYSVSLKDLKCGVYVLQIGNAGSMLVRVK